MKVYKVRTECGRNFAWSAESMDDLFISLSRRSYFAKHVELLEEIGRDRIASSEPVLY